MADQTNLQKKLITIGSAAEYLGVSTDTIRRWDKLGNLHSVRLNGDKRHFFFKELESLKNSKPLTISEAAGKLGLSISTLRRLEARGLLIPARDKTGDRIYSRKALNRFIQPGYFKKEEIEALTQKENFDHHRQAIRPHFYRGRGSLAILFVGIFFGLLFSNFPSPEQKTQIFDYKQENLSAKLAPKIGPDDKIQLVSQIANPQGPYILEVGNEMKDERTLLSPTSAPTVYLQSTELEDILFVGAPTIEGIGTIDVGDTLSIQVDAKELKIVRAESTGQGTLEIGTKVVRIESPIVSKSSKILLTPNTLTAQVLTVTKKEEGAFTVEVTLPETKDIKFDWFVLGN